MFALYLPRSLDARLRALARKSGRTKTALARQAVVANIEDLEDRYLVVARAQKNLRAIPLGDVASQLDLDR